MHHITGRLEINALDYKTQIPKIGEFAAQQRCPAIVALPQFVPALIAGRTGKTSFYKIIAAIDFPEGGNFAMQKVRDMGEDAFAADGFEVLCSVNRSAAEIYNEVKSVTEFLRSMNQVAEIRWVIPYNAPADKINDYYNAFKKPQVTQIRFGQHLSTQLVHTGHYKGQLESLRRSLSNQVKLGGNITREVVDAFIADKSVRFDVSYQQALNLLKEYQETPKAKEGEPANTAPVSTPVKTDGEKISGGQLGQDVY